MGEAYPAKLERTWNAQRMWNLARNEIREVAYLAAMVSGLSVLGVGLAVVLVVVGVA
jgi:poly(3-hydroxybutyrate) depolymerase